jgi:hypothetical protein
MVHVAIPKQPINQFRKQVPLMPEHPWSSSVAEVYYLLPFRELHFIYLVDLKEVAIKFWSNLPQGFDIS